MALIRNTKAGREESRYLSAEAVKCLKAWLKSADIKDGAVFRRFTPRGTVGQTAIAPQEMARIIQRVGLLLNDGRIPAKFAWPTDRLVPTRLTSVLPMI